MLNETISLTELIDYADASKDSPKATCIEALVEIIKIKQKQTQELITAIKAICECEEKNSIKKIHVAALEMAEK